MENNVASYTYVGIDVAKDTLQIDMPGSSRGIQYADGPLDELAAALLELDSPLAALEPTGGYERRLLQRLRQAGVPCHLADTRRVKGFAASEGQRAKTDPIDAALLRRYAQEKRLAPTPEPSATERDMAELLDRRAQLSSLLAQEKNRLAKAGERIAPLVERTIQHAQEQIRDIDQAIEELTRADAQAGRRVEALLSICGVGKVTAWTVIAYMGRIEDMDRARAVALAGLAPFARDSGKKSGRRYIQCGKAKVRRTLYMAAKTAAIHNPVIRDYVSRLVNERGKPYMVAIVAAMRKLLIHMQSVLRKSQIELA